MTGSILRLAAIFAIAGGANACVSEAQLHETLVTRAAFDLDCPESDIRVVELDQSSRGASGCGRRATYIGVCQHFSCTWVAQGRIEEATR
jgi:hypothetical protein